MAESKDQANPVVRAVMIAKREADQAKRNRMQQNKENMDCYHLRGDWSHKRPGQSREFLAKQNVAVEQLVSFLQQGLIDKGDWFAIESQPGIKEMNRTILPSDMFKILRDQMEKCDSYTLMGDAIKSGSLQSLMIVKVHGQKVQSVKYRTELQRHGFMNMKIKKVLKKDEKQVWRLKIDLVRPEDYYPDPTGRGLYECEDIEMDLWELKKIAKENPEVYDQTQIDQLAAFVDEDQRGKKARETDQNTTTERRQTVKVTEYWGTLIDPDTNEVIYENAVCAVANDNFLIRPAQPNPLWHGESPYVAAPIRRVPNSVWHQALMDAPTKHNHSLNEVYNLMLDAGLQSVFGVRQVRENWLEDPSEIADGIPAGTTLRVSSTCPPGSKVMERLDTSTEFTQATAIYNLTDKEFYASGFSSDLRVGALPDRQVKATEIVASSQALSGISGGMVKTIESSFVSKILGKAWPTIAQNLDDYSSDEMKAILGEEKALAIASMAPEDRFAETALGHTFRVFGMSTVMNRIKEFQKIQSFLGSIAASPLLMAEFMKRYDIGKFLGQIAKSLDIDTDKIARDETSNIEDGRGEQAANPDEMAQIVAHIQSMTNQGGQAGGDQMSQVPQASSQRRTAESPVPRGAMLSGGMTTPGR